jgi:hypothetical protein
MRYPIERGINAAGKRVWNLYRHPWDGERRFVSEHPSQQEARDARNTLLQTTPPEGPVSICHITEYGLTQRLSFQIKVF